MRRAEATPKTTIADLVYDELAKEYPGGLTYNQLATRLNLNEPSVRRTMQQLRRNGLVDWTYADYQCHHIAWRKAR